jgi:hypothetical protein
METEEFLRRCEEIESGIHRLADDMYAVAEGRITDKARDEVIRRSQEKVRLYDEFMEQLEDEDDREEAQGVLENYVKSLRQDLGRLAAKA